MKAASPETLRKLAELARAFSAGVHGFTGISFRLADGTRVSARFAGGTHIARGAGITASCTVDTRSALLLWAGKAEARAAEIEAALA